MVEWTPTDGLQIGPNGFSVTALPDVITPYTCLLYTSDAADERSSVDLGGRRIIKKKTSRTLSRIDDVNRTKPSDLLR